jgi:hypothetical protein
MDPQDCDYVPPSHLIHHDAGSARGAGTMHPCPPDSPSDTPGVLSARMDDSIRHRLKSTL